MPISASEHFISKDGYAADIQSAWTGFPVSPCTYRVEVFKIPTFSLIPSGKYLIESPGWLVHNQLRTKIVE